MNLFRLVLETPHRASTDVNQWKQMCINPLLDLILVKWLSDSTVKRFFNIHFRYNNINTKWINAVTLHDKNSTDIVFRLKIFITRTLSLCITTKLTACLKQKNKCIQYQEKSWNAEGYNTYYFIHINNDVFIQSWLPVFKIYPLLFHL